MAGVRENISIHTVKSKTGSILERLAPEYGISAAKVMEIAPRIVDELLKYKHIDKLVVIKVAEAVAPQLPMLGSKLYDGLKLCSEEDRAKIMMMGIGATTVSVLGAFGTHVIEIGLVQKGKTDRMQIIFDVLSKLTPGGIIKSLKK